MKFNKDEVCILIPTLNEGMTIGNIVREFTALGYTHILVIDGKNLTRVGRAFGERLLFQFVAQSGAPGHYNSDRNCQQRCKTQTQERKPFAVGRGDLGSKAEVRLD